MRVILQERKNLNFSRRDRFREFLRRLLDAECAESQSAALALIAETLIAVEDEMTEIPNLPDNWQTDGRMYPPQSDQARDVTDHPDLVRYRSRGHNTLVRDNGAIEIRDLQGDILLSKPGKDGVGVEYE